MYKSNEDGVLGLGAWTKPYGEDDNSKAKSVVYQLKDKNFITRGMVSYDIHYPEKIEDSKILLGEIDHNKYDKDMDWFDSAS